jgi:5'/3'-nucleotidase
MQLLLTNDDGIGAPGLAALIEAVSGLGQPLVVAPSSPQSGASHAMSDRTPLRVTPFPMPPPVGASHAVDGRPADCVRLGLCHYATGAGWVISGINAGGNVGVDVYYSGTVAAAREAAILGRPAVAVSQFIRSPRTLDWRRSARWTAHVLRQILALPVEPGVFWNVNLPQPEGERSTVEVVCAPLAIDPLDVRYHRDEHPDEVSVFHYRGIYLERRRTDGTDVDTVFSDRIAVTRMGLDSLARPGAMPRFTSPPV